MASKRMSISALLSSDSTPAVQHSESSNAQQPSHYHSYHPEIESVPDSISKRSKESTSAETHFSQTHPSFSNSNFYQSPDNNRLSPLNHESRSAAQWPGHSYPRVADRLQYQTQEEETRSYYHHSSSPSYGHRIPERERVAVPRPSSSAHTPIQTPHPEHLHPTVRPHPAEYRERDNWRFSAPSSSINPNTDTSDSLLSVLTRTAASEATAGPGHSRNTSNANLTGSHSLRPPSTLRRDRNEEVERDRNRAAEREREREMLTRSQLPHDYQRSPFTHPEALNSPYHYHPDTSQSPDMQVLRARSDSHGSASAVPSIQYTPSSRSPSRLQQPVYTSSGNIQYHQRIPPDAQSQPLSHSHHSQHRPPIENPNYRTPSATARSVPMPPRLGLTLPLSLSPATMSSQLVSPISPQNPSRGSVQGIKTQAHSRSAQYSQAASPASSRSPVMAPSKERPTPQTLPGKAPNPTVFQSLRTPVPQPMPLHRLSIPQTSTMSNMASSPHPAGFAPFSPQQHQGSRRVPNPSSTPGPESVKDTREKDLRLSRNQTAYHTSGNPDMEATKRHTERNNVVSRTPTIYDQRRTTESRVEVPSEKPRNTNDLTPHPQEKRSSSLDKGFRLWNNGPLIEDTTPPQRMEVEVRQPTIKKETKPNEQAEVSSRSHLFRQEDSLTRCSTLPLGTLPVPNVERQQIMNPYVRVGGEQGTFSHAPTQHKGGRNRPVLPEDLREGVASRQQPKPSPLPGSPPTNPTSKLRPWHYPNPYPDEQRRVSPRESVSESKERPFDTQSPVAGSIFKPQTPKPLSLVMETSVETLSSRSSEKDVPLHHTQSPSVRPNRPSRSPHSSATDTMSSGKNSEADTQGPSPALSGGLPVLSESVQYPLPSPTEDMVLSKEEDKEYHKEPGQTHGYDETISPRPSTESVPPVLSPLSPLVPPLVQPTMEIEITHESSEDIRNTKPVGQSDSPAEQHLVPLVLSKDVGEFQPETVDASLHSEAKMTDDKPTEQLLVDFADVSMKDVDSQSTPGLVDGPDPQPSLIEVKDEGNNGKHAVEGPLPSPAFVSPIRGPLSSMMDNQNNSLESLEQTPLPEESMINDTICEEENKVSICDSIPTSQQSPKQVFENECVQQGDLRDVASPELEMSPAAIDSDAVPVPAVLPNKSDPTDDPKVVIQQLNDEPFAQEDVAGRDESAEKVDVMDISLDVQVQEATHPQVEGRSLDDELLSLVDDVDLKPVPDVKPKIVSESPHSPIETTSSLAVPSTISRKASGSVTPAKTTKAQKSRGQGKSSKSKNIRLDSETVTPSSPNSGNTPTPRPSSKPSARPKKAVPGFRKKTVTTQSTAARSSSAMPEPAPETTPAPLEERLYCVCHRPYDEEKVMIACDRCDEWYHPRCVDMPEQEIDLVDQFICEKCMSRYPGLKTTYKTRCYRGTHHISDYDENPPCWKTVKGAFSKYCSDACGIAHMRAKIARSGKSGNQLWPFVRHAKRREGVTVEYLYDGPNVNKRVKLGNGNTIEANETKRAQFYLNGIETESPNIKVHTSTNGDRTRLAVLKRRIATVRSSKNQCKLELEYVTTRRRLLDLAVERASEKFCGWDTRLEMGDLEWATWIVSLEGKGALYGNQDHPDTDDSAEEDVSWLCQGPVECPRHHGWKTVRDLELQMEVDSKNGSIKQFLETERELKSKIEEMDTTPRSVNKFAKTSG